METAKEILDSKKDSRVNLTHSFGEKDILEAMGEYAEKKAQHFLDWITKEDSPYAVLYSNDEIRFCDEVNDYTIKQLWDIYIKST